jgi:hypothetical protein
MKKSTVFKLKLWDDQKVPQKLNNDVVAGSELTFDHPISREFIDGILSNYWPFEGESYRVRAIAGVGSIYTSTIDERFVVSRITTYGPFCAKLLLSCAGNPVSFTSIRRMERLGVEIELERGLPVELPEGAVDYYEEQIYYNENGGENP